MPSKTRSQAAAESLKEEHVVVAHELGVESSSEDHAVSREQAAVHEGSVRTKDFSSRAPPSPPRDNQYATPRSGCPRSSSSAPRSSSRHRSMSPPESSRKWQDRNRGYRSSDHMFSPQQPYKSDRSQHSQDQGQHPHHSMDYREGRDYDLLGGVRPEEIIGHAEDDPLFLGSFTEDSPPRRERRSPGAEPGSDRKRPSSSIHPRRSPPQGPYYHGPPPHGSPIYSSSSYRRSPRSTPSQQYHSTSSHHHQHTPYQYGSYPQSSPSSHGHYYRSSPPGSGARSGYYSGHSSYYNYPYPPQESWDRPPPPGYRPPFDEEEDQIPVPPSSSKKRPSPSSADHHQPPNSPGGRGAQPQGGATTTPEKIIKRGSPFRSPPTSAAKFKRSPLYSASPGTYAGSFGMMDTPGGTLAAKFSPMEDPFFPEEATPFPLGEEGAFGGRLRIARSGSTDGSDPTGLPHSRRKDDGSPLSGLIRVLSPLDSGIRGVPKSPLRRSTFPDDARNPRSPDDPNPPKGAVVTMSGSRGQPGPRIRGSPMEASGTAKPRKLWPSSGGGDSSAGPPGSGVRVQLGRFGPMSTGQSLEGINSMMQVREATPSSHGKYDSRAPPHPYHPPHHHPHPHHPPHPPPPPHHHHHHHPGAYLGEMATPSKSIGHHRHTPQSARGPYMPTGSGSKPVYPGEKGMYGSAQKVGHPRAVPPDYGPDHKPRYPGSEQKMGSSQKIPVPSGKENKKSSPSSRRGPCNCKKSKCLKLYCECFAAERFCQGCNCNDCKNVPEHSQERDKAMKETRAKNPNAFKPRIGAKPTPVGNSTQNGHNMGCRCKKSECLKKYCECFQAGVICGVKCKCSDCQNFVGSQALIDKRRKIKDQPGADFAMRIADEVWKGQPGGPRKSNLPPSARRGQHPLTSPGRRLPPHMMHPSPRGPPPPGPPHHPHYMPHHQGMMMGRPPMGGHMHMGYPSMGMPMTPAGYPKHSPMSGEPPRGMYPPPQGNPSGGRHRPPPKQAAATPKTPAVRVSFDPASSRKKRKLSPGDKEPVFPYFGKDLPEQPKTTVLAIFSFLSNDELYNAGLVCKKWTQLAMDGELWKFES